MKKLIIVFALTLSVAACKPSHTEEEIQQARQAVLDSIETRNREQGLKQRTIDSMNQVAEQEKPEQRRRTEASESGSAETTTKKKGMSNTGKGALIGAGAGAVTGAVTGAAVSGQKGKGAVIGGLIGAAAGAGVGAITGKTIDKKKEEAKENP